MLVRKKRQSLLEKFLRNTRTPFIPEFRLKGSKFRYDIYIPQINTCIDIDSTWYHKSCWSKYRSHIKREIANSSGFTTIHIKDDYFHLKRIKQLISEARKKIIDKNSKKN